MSSRYIRGFSMAARGIIARLCFHLQAVLPGLWLPWLNKHPLLFTGQTGMAVLSVTFDSFIAHLFCFHGQSSALQTRAKNHGPRWKDGSTFSTRVFSLVFQDQTSRSGLAALFHWLFAYWRCWLSHSAGFRAHWCHLKQPLWKPLYAEMKWQDSCEVVVL